MLINGLWAKTPCPNSNMQHWKDFLAPCAIFPFCFTSKSHFSSVIVLHILLLCGKAWCQQLKYAQLNWLVILNENICMDQKSTACNVVSHVKGNWYDVLMYEYDHNGISQREETEYIISKANSEKRQQLLLRSLTINKVSSKIYNTEYSYVCLICIRFILKHLNWNSFNKLNTACSTQNRI